MLLSHYQTLLHIRSCLIISASVMRTSLRQTSFVRSAYEAKVYRILWRCRVQGFIGSVIFWFRKMNSKMNEITGENYGEPWVGASLHARTLFTCKPFINLSKTIQCKRIPIVIFFILVWVQTRVNFCGNIQGSFIVLVYIAKSSGKIS